MLNSDVAKRYAFALFSIAKEENILDQVQHNLEGVLDLYKQEDDFRNMMMHPLIPSKDKKAVIEKIVGDSIHPMALNFLRVLIDRKREGGLPQILGEYVKLANDERNMLVVQVTTAVPLDQKQFETMRDRLSKSTGKEIILHHGVDKDLIGGVVMRVGDQILDGSIKKRLALVGQQMARAQVKQIGVSG